MGGHTGLEDKALYIFFFLVNMRDISCLGNTDKKHGEIDLATL